MGTVRNILKVNDFPFHWIEKHWSLPNSGEMKEHAKGCTEFSVHFLRKKVIWQ